MGLTNAQIDRFIAEGAVRIEGAFTPATAAACRDILWRDLNLSPDRPEEWKEPVMRLGMYADPPFREAAAAPRIVEAYDQLAGPGRWIPMQALGSMVVRFPVGKPWDDGWHVDASFPPEDDPASHDYIRWRVNLHSRARMLLVLFLFSDCGPHDAPTRVRVGSHLPTARRLAAYGEAGASLLDLAKEGYPESDRCDVALATGAAGTVWLLHPFTVHAAQAHHGQAPRFLAQPGLMARPAGVTPPWGDGDSPIERAIRLGLAR